MTPSKKHLPDLPEAPKTMVRPIFRIHRTCLRPAEDNPKDPTNQTLNNLVQSIRESGFNENLLVVPDDNFPKPKLPKPWEKINEGMFVIVSGHNKFRACEVVGIDHIPCAVALDWDEDFRQFVMIRMNSIKDPINAGKFATLHDKLIGKYTEEAVDTMMLFSDQNAIQQMLGSVRKALPSKRQREKLDERKGEVKSVDDLASVVTEMFKESGNTLDRGYMIFTFGKSDHIYVTMTKELKPLVDALVLRSESESTHIAELFVEALSK